MLGVTVAVPDEDLAISAGAVAGVGATGVLTSASLLARSGLSPKGVQVLPALIQRGFKQPSPRHRQGPGRRQAIFGHDLLKGMGARPWYGVGRPCPTQGSGAHADIESHSVAPLLGTLP